MKRIGLTGGIASGKTTVAQMLRARGAAIIDADQLAREVLAPGSEGLREVAARFADVVKDGQLDRAALGARIFSDGEARAALNAITPPRIQQAVLREMQIFEGRGEPFCIYDSPLLIENGLQALCDAVIVVWVDRATQLQRLMQRNALSQADAEARLAAQWPLDDKRAHATWVIDNSGSLAQTQSQVDALWPRLSLGGFA